MSRKQHDYDVNLVDLAKRIRETLKQKGWSDARFEREAGLSGGTLSRLGSGARKRISHQMLRRITDVLGDSYLSIVFGVDIGRRLDEVPGYSDAELEVARLEPWIPLDVIRAARQTHLSVAPPTITTEFLRDYLRLIAEHTFGISPSAAPAESGERRRTARDAGSRAASSAERRRQPAPARAPQKRRN